MLAAMGLTLAAMQFRPLDGTAVMRASLRYSMPALLLWLCFVISQVKGRSTAHREVGLLSLMSLICFLLGGGALATIVNGWADAGPAGSHEAQVIRTYSSSGRSKTYHVVVTSWRRPQRTEDLIVSSGAYHDAQPQRHITVVTRPGRLGFEWIVSYALGERGR